MENRVCSLNYFLKSCPLSQPYTIIFEATALTLFLLLRLTKPHCTCSIRTANFESGAYSWQWSQSRMIITLLIR